MPELVFNYELRTTSYELFYLLTKDKGLRSNVKGLIYVPFIIMFVIV